MLPYGRQSIDSTDIAAVVEALQSDFLTGGPRVDEFERRFADRIGARHAVAVSNATAALHLALRVANLGPGDRVVTSPNTFLASANCAPYVGAIPDFADIDPVSCNLSPEALEKNWQQDTRAVVAVDFAGQPCDLPAIANLARKHRAIVIEDACHAVGSAFAHEGRIWKVGGHPWADLTVFSFHPVKTMTTGEGGILATENDAWAAEARRLRSHGVERKTFVGLGDDGDPAFAERGPWYHEMRELGFNYRLSDLQCALGLSQLSRLEGFIARRREIVARYNQAFADLPWLATPGLKDPANRDLISWHLYVVRIDFAALGRSRTRVMGDLQMKGIGSQVHYIPVHLQPWYRKSYGFSLGKCPVAEDYYRRALSLPLYPGMGDSDVERVIAAVRALHE
jgi:UDP-4-amino-4,6-dideoxy-N-acetyl-beta-L-altrosamine transaminase